MQENRSFDHYFGTLQGVRGFGDRASVLLSGGYSVFNQPNGSGRQYPWNLSNGSGNIVASAETLAQCDGSLDHSWSTQHEAWDGGKMDAWVSAKGSNRTMGYLTRKDVPFHYALADAYTICDAYHCSILSATGPNRTYLWSGMIDPNGTAGGPAYDGGSESGLSWQTYAETLQDAGVSWKVYQVAATTSATTRSPTSTSSPTPRPARLCTSTAWDRTRQRRRPRPPTSPPRSRATSSPAPCRRCPGWWPTSSPPSTRTPRRRTAPTSSTRCSRPSPPTPTCSTPPSLFLNYDENDGFFDHVPPPIPPAGTADEFIQNGTPIGLGFRVPMISISPWTRGGWVDLADLRPHLGDPLPGDLDRRARHPGGCARTSATGGARSAAT